VAADGEIDDRRDRLARLVRASARRPGQHQRETRDDAEEQAGKRLRAHPGTSAAGMVSKVVVSP
jgi:hypothetical protein